MNDPLPSRETRAEIRERLAGNLSVINHHIGHRLKMRRKVLRLSQGALGGFVGVSFQQIQKYEHGSNRMCAALLYQLGTVLHVPISYFFDRMPISFPMAAEDAESAASSVRTLTDLPPALQKQIMDLISSIAKDQ
jgi:transcriptional regulator with XRE-family HTH domain